MNYRTAIEFSRFELGYYFVSKKVPDGHHQIHCSGHAKGEDLMDMVKEIDAKMLFPIHTEYPTEYVKVTNKITIVDMNKKYSI